MKKFLILLIPLFSVLLLFTIYHLPFTQLVSRADELDDVSRQLTEEQKRLNDLEARKNALAQAISSASISLSKVSAELSAAETELEAISAQLQAKEVALAQRELERNTLVRQLYKLKATNSPLEIFIGGDDLIDSTRNLQYFERGLSNLASQITALVGEITTFKESKARAEQLRNDLAALRAQYQASLSASRNQLASTEGQLSQVKSSITNLTAQQEQLILAKFAATAQRETVGDNEPLSEPLPNPNFAPAWMVAAYGYPHRVGMNQYGAYGRAKAGQPFPTILSAYYPNTVLEGACDKTRRINVQGYGEILLEDEYLTGIGEMPASWGSAGGMEALKAQVVAARSYALDYISRTGPICTTQSCQVFLGSGAKNGTPWQQAVNDTCGQILTYSGAPIAAWYASTAGGYTLSSQEVWGGYRAWALGLKDFGPNGAYDGSAYGNSPWYHTGWGSRNGTKGEYHPWMTEEEFADIFNALLLSKHSDSYNQYLSPIDKGGWSMGQVRNELSTLGITPYTSLAAAVTTFTANEANTASIYISGSGGTRTFGAVDFWAMFNLRSRGTLQIPTHRFDLGYCSQLASCSTSVQFK